MNKAFITRVLLVAGALFMTVLLFMAPKSPDKKQELAATKNQGVGADANLDVFLRLAEKNVSPTEKLRLDEFRQNKDWDSLTAFWTKRKRPELASLFAEERAKKSNKAQDWFEAGNRYYYSAQFVADQSEIPVVYQSAIRSFKNGLKKDPANTDGKIMLASCYTESGGEPMQGISLLREIERSDSNNVKLQLTFAMMSVKSNQLEKAVRRFKKALALDSTYIEAYLHLADAYTGLGDTQSAVQMLESYSSKTPDFTTKLEVNKYIKQLKESNNH
jgi:predicted Zn-dependent protease